jgi:hypothetical protein
MSAQGTTATSPNSETAARELFALTDEQILEIGPQGTNDGAGVEQPLLAVPAHNAGEDNAIQNSDGADRFEVSAQSQAAEKAQPGVAVLPAEPPKWLAGLMADPQAGAEARDLWSGRACWAKSTLRFTVGQGTHRKKRVPRERRSRSA